MQVYLSLNGLLAPAYLKRETLPLWMQKQLRAGYYSAVTHTDSLFGQVPAPLTARHSTPLTAPPGPDPIPTPFCALCRTLCTPRGTDPSPKSPLRGICSRQLFEASAQIPDRGNGLLSLSFLCFRRPSEASDASTVTNCILRNRVRASFR